MANAKIREQQFAPCVFWNITSHILWTFYLHIICFMQIDAFVILFKIYLKLSWFASKNSN